MAGRLIQKRLRLMIGILIQSDIIIRVNNCITMSRHKSSTY